MIKPVVRLDYDDLTELIPSFLTITPIGFSYKIGVGMTAGLLSYPLLMVVSGRRREVPPALWVLASLSLLFYVSYPYR